MHRPHPHPLSQTVPLHTAPHQTTHQPHPATPTHTHTVVFSGPNETSPVAAPSDTNLKHMLTDAGVHAVTVACRMPSPVLAADISPDKVLGDYNCWELVQALTRAKWQHQWVGRKERPDPYEPHADSPKLVWYTRRQKEPGLRRLYMLAL